MMSVFKQERDPDGREIIEIGMNAALMKAAAVVAPLVFVGLAYIFTGRGPAPFPWFMVAIPIGFAIVAVPVAGWMARKSQVRITLDTKAGRILYSTSGVNSELRMGDVAAAEFASTVSRSTDSGNNTREITVYRLEFVKKDGERLPVTATYSNVYSLEHQRKTVAAINAALGRRMVQ